MRQTSRTKNRAADIRIGQDPCQRNFGASPVLLFVKEAKVFAAREIGAMIFPRTGGIPEVANASGAVKRPGVEASSQCVASQNSDSPFRQFPNHRCALRA